VAYQMEPLLMTLNDLEGHFCCLKPFFHTSWNRTDIARRAVPVL